MERLGLMTDAGRAVLPDMSDNGFQIDTEILQALQSDFVVWDNFCRLPELYKRIRIDTIQINRKHRPEVFKSRLKKSYKTLALGFCTVNGMTTDVY